MTRRPPRFSEGNEVVYWGKRQSLQGLTMTIAYVVTCSCKHQTYAVDYVLPDGTEGRLDQVLEESLYPK